MIEPLLRQMELQGFQNIDFDFLLCLAKHPRLPLREAMLLAHQLGKLALNDRFYGRLAAVPFLLILHRFHGDPTTLAYVEKYAKVALSLFMRAAAPPTNPGRFHTLVRRDIVTALCRATYLI
jgi:hypothetical protein